MGVMSESAPRAAQPGPRSVGLAPALLAWVGALALAAGLIVYGALRPWGVPGHGWLPSALHALAFVLWIGLLLRTRGAALLALATGWSLLAVGIEAVQHPAWHAHLPAALARVWHGTYSEADVVATLAGAAAAALALHFTRFPGDPR